MAYAPLSHQPRRLERPARPRRRCTAFTIVELLVVIAIITILIAILFPTLKRARRSAVVLACPIVSATAARGVFIVHPTGRAELLLAPAWTLDSNGHASHPVWSPNGRWIGYGGSALMGSAGYHVAILDPFSGRVIRHPTNQGAGSAWFMGWADDSSFITSTVDHYFVHDAESGAVRESYGVSDRRGTNLPVSPVPASTGWHYVTVVYQTHGVGLYPAVAMLKRDFSLGKTIWVERESPRTPLPLPRVDPFGEYVAWTRKHPSTGGLSVAVKGIREPVDRMPSIVGIQYGSAAFCDWTEDSKLLVAARNVGESTRLIVLNLDGRLHSEIPIDEIVRDEAGCASWRKYWRR